MKGIKSTWAASAHARTARTNVCTKVRMQLPDQQRNPRALRSGNECRRTARRQGRANQRSNGRLDSGEQRMGQRLLRLHCSLGLRSGAVKCKHNGQSRAWCPAGAASAPSSPTTTSFIALPVVQTSCSSCGCTMGDAMAAPMVTMNHARMRRPNNDDVRSVCMLRIITVIRRKLHSRFVCHQPWSMRQKCFSCRFAAKVSLGWQR